MFFQVFFLALRQLDKKLHTCRENGESVQFYGADDGFCLLGYSLTLEISTR